RLAQNYRLIATFNDSVLVGKPMRLRAYRVTSVNGRPWADSAPHFPGPTFRVSQGDSVRIRLVNNLPPGDSTRCLPMQVGGHQDTPPDCFHGFNYTNIHYHGFHVSPSPNADDVLMQIAPGDSFQYAFRIPANQSPGTHWYHPHKHGSVAIQVANGMSGAFEVVGASGGLDSVQAANRITERLLAFQQVTDTLNLMDSSSAGVASTLVNGQFRPQVIMQQGEVQRWRIVNENTTKTSAFSLIFQNTVGGQVPAVFEVARDGVTYDSLNYDTISDEVLLLAPGNRLDVLVRAPQTAGVFQALITHVEHVEPDDRSRKRLRLGAGTGRAAVGPPPNTTPVLSVRVVPTTGPVTSTLPTTLPSLGGFLANIPGPLDPTRISPDSMEVVVFSAGGGPGSAPPFYLGTELAPLRQFHPDSVYVPTTGISAQSVERPMNLSGTQTWRVVNTDRRTNHPFHIHINPFQVVYVYAPSATDQYRALYDRLNDAAQIGKPIWLDVLPLPQATAAGTQGYAIIRQQYEDFPGWYVMHCHILGHEERGMMQVLQVVAPGDTVRPPPSWVTNPTESGTAAHRH
ncbi:multicopper oxidase family protein, partial [Longimicrobium sp.]|uniref:multicopper oxidase family protein n=1 Tax=Longimicrobium sp. TaxID=2029185 RepID=UPI002F91DE10